MTVNNSPSRFWGNLSVQHARDLDSFGLDQFKRRQALRYFTWRWSWASLWRSGQMRFLLRNLSPATVFRCARAPVDLSDEAWSGVDWPRRDRWLYAFATRLIWSYAQKVDRFGVLQLDEPPAGQPLPVHWGGRLISQDLANTACETASFMAFFGQTPRRVVEIGGGYGRTAYALLSLFPQVTYTIVDIEPALTISKWYLSGLFGAERLRFLSPDDSHLLADGAFDLALSISSLQEMKASQAGDYIGLIDRIAAGGLVYFKQWRIWRNPEDLFTFNFDLLAIPKNWTLQLRRKCAIQTSFSEAVWRVGKGHP